MHVLAYWLARLALVFAVFVALWGLGWTPWFAFPAAVMIAWLIAYAMFGSMHDAAARRMERWVSRRFVGVAEDEVAAKPVVPGGEASKPVARSRAGAKQVAVARVKPVDASPAKPKVAARRSG